MIIPTTLSFALSPFRLSSCDIALEFILYLFLLSVLLLVVPILVIFVEGFGAVLAINIAFKIFLICFSSLQVLVELHCSVSIIVHFGS